MKISLTRSSKQSRRIPNLAFHAICGELQYMYCIASKPGIPTNKMGSIRHAERYFLLLYHYYSTRFCFSNALSYVLMSHPLISILRATTVCFCVCVIPIVAIRTSEQRGRCSPSSSVASSRYTESAKVGSSYRCLPDRVQAVASDRYVFALRPRRTLVWTSCPRNLCPFDKTQVRRHYHVFGRDWPHHHYCHHS